MKKHIFVGLLVAASAFSALAQSDAKLIRLATLEWPPFTGLLLPKEGVSTYIATTVAKAAGFRLLAASFEWTKAVEKGEKNPDFEGYFPEYFSQERDAACYLSQSIGVSVLGVASLKSSPVVWNKLSNLESVRLGVVDGYVNGDELDAAIKDKRQAVEVASSDAVNIAKLRAKKIRAIVIDKNVLDYTLFSLGERTNVVFSPNPIARLSLHICFKRNPAGLDLRNAFDAALARTDIAKLEAEYFQRMFSQH
ncbi:MAG: transporter substrate-binding domain-containing protein [Betaproteobacteria bacterium]